MTTISQGCDSEGNFKIMTEKYLGERTPKLGFGFMRLPKKNDNTFDMDLTKKMVDVFLAKGFTYFDTAHIYTQVLKRPYVRYLLSDILVKILHSRPSSR